ncbi:MAG: MBL fold metallo-hydrolase, partial [Micropruina sp.]
MAMTLTFLGAAETVTGSKYLLRIDDRSVLVDAGMFQGEKRWREQNWEPFPLPPVAITDVLLTHAHADHCGYLPALVAEGFRGRIWATPATRQLAAIVLRDAARLQERETQHAIEGGYSKHRNPIPLYTVEDAERTLPLFRDVAYDHDTDLGNGLTARFTRAGHILGSASITVRHGADAVVFSGDLG